MVFSWPIPQGMVDLVRAQFDGLLSQSGDGRPTADVYRPHPLTRELPSTPTLSALSVQVEPISRLSNPAVDPAGLESQNEVRYQLHFDHLVDIRVRDVIKVGPDTYTAMGVHTRTTYGVFTFVDAVEGS